MGPLGAHEGQGNMKWTRKRVLAAAGLSVAGLASVFAGAAWAPPTDTASPTFGGVTLSVDGAEVARFSRCLGLGTKTEVVKFQSGDAGGGSSVSMLPGRSEAGKIVCERGLSADLTLAGWRDMVVSGDTAARKNAAFVIHDSVGAPVARWHVVNAWPSELTNYFSASTGREVVTFVGDATARVAP